MTVPKSHPTIVDGWFREINTQWPGQAMTLKVKRILHHEKSLYQDVLVFESETYGNVLVLDSVIQCTERDEFSYQEMIAHLPLASHPNPKQVLVIGGGDGGVIREVLKHKSVEKVTLCDIDEAVIRVSKEFLPHMSACYKDSRVTVHIGDGFKFLPEHKDEYDVIITDSSDPVGPAEALFKAPYFTLLKESLKEGGNISTQAECIWLHLPLIKELKETCKKTFAVAEYAFTTIPTYPAGQIGIMVCSKEAGRDLKTPLRAVPNTKYYNSDVHRGAYLALPEFGRAMLEDGVNVLPKLKPSNVTPKTTKKKVLLLGSGLVAGPAAEYITRHNHELTVGCRTFATAEALCEGLPNASPISIDVGSTDALRQAIKGHDVVVSLVPYTYHAGVMKAALAEKCSVVTTSYINPAMKALEKEFIDAGLVCFNEIGVDPGVDHLWAIKTIDEVHKAGGKIKSFYSYCGGLPEPSASDNALGYKFSWSPVGVLMALNNDGKFLKNGDFAGVAGKDLMASAKPYYFTPAYNLVCYPNRDSSVFREFYNIPECENLVRGTLRYGGFCEVAMAWKEIGLLEDTPVEYLARNASPITWIEVMGKLLSVEATEEAVIGKLRTLKSFPEDQARILLGKFRQLGLFSSEQVTLRESPMRTLAALLEEKCTFKEGEADIVLLQHSFEVEYADGKTETLTSTLEQYGDRNGGPSAMATLVGVPCGMAVQFVLEGVLNKPGVHAPYDEETCKLFRDRLEKEEGITMVERVV
ncbi:Saccharopine dehydrogenase-domain-containing protein [Naematelia encephala]|uniref:Saccharopine dehydrogenase-domain-containing protein n=1 Tax=Naematelia encephala TaxID=71784 RepID=A0A1Y2B5A5_9TREE|nr:Saccharopine dehydrogenase-domain-containing protein [Naematelia encephala]